MAGYSLDKVRKNTNREDSGRVIYEAMFKESVTKSIKSLALTDLYAAPIEWNFFKDLDELKLKELEESIQKEALLNPIIVWKIDRSLVELYYSKTENDEASNLYGNDYMILAGHHRVKAFKNLYQKTGDEKYARIDAYVQVELDKDRAEYIVVATNYVQRELSKKDKRKSILFMYNTLRKQNYKKGDALSQVSEHIDVVPRHIQREIALVEKLTPQFYNMYDDGEITQSVALKVSKLSSEQQNYLVNNYSDKLNNDNLKKIDVKKIEKKGYEDIFLEKEGPEMVKVSFNVPGSISEAFRRKCYRMLEDMMSREDSDKNNKVKGED